LTARDDKETINPHDMDRMPASANSRFAKSQSGHNRDFGGVGGGFCERFGETPEVSAYMHLLMKDADNIDGVFGKTIENTMHADGIFEISWPNINRPTEFPPRRQSFHG
jgi:hypothetical protein